MGDSMSKIRVMDENLANKIAAGEVVERIVSIVKELVENSIDADSDEIKIELIESGLREIKITDNGIGMDSYELDNVKEMFYTTKKNGTGLGVALSNEIILAHNGMIRYDSVKNEGTKCIISLPI